MRCMNEREDHDDQAAGEQEPSHHESSLCITRVDLAACFVPMRLASRLTMAAVTLLLVGCQSRRPARATGGNFAEHPIVLITIDTLRADRLGSYGSSRGLTPTLDAFAQTAARFTSAIAQVPLTLPSHATILTGRHPAAHGVRTNDGFRLDASTPTLATALHDRGFQTGAFIGGYPLQSASGLARGFDVYDDTFLNTPGVTERRADQVVQAAGDWIEARGTQPFFAWIHLFDPHSPYDPPAEYAAAHRGAPYDGEIAYTDAAIARFFDRLRRLSLLARSTVVVVADHGESLGEHGERTHGTFLYDATIHVPLLVKLPGQTSSRVIDAPVETADLAPTLAQIADAALPSTDGRSLRPLLDGAAGDPERATYAESYYLNVLLGWSPLRAIRTSQWKYIEAPRPELYDLHADPGELHSVAAAHRALASGLGAALGREQGIVFPADLARGDAANRLRSLGYASGATASTPAARGIDPKDRTTEWSEIERGIDLIAGDPARSAEAFNHVLRLDPANGLAMKYLGDLAFRAARLQDAQTEYTRAIGAGLRHPDVYVNLASIGEREGRLADAAAALAQAVRVAPADADAWNRLGLLDTRLGRLADAADAFAKAIAAAPDRAEAYYNAAVIARRAGRGDEARDRLHQAIARNPRYAEARYELATLQLAAGDPQGALAEYRAALDARPDYAEALFGAARAELDLQMRDEARRDYERFVRVAPRAFAPQIAAARRVLQQLAASR